jgi:branched-chain amino acid transport system ATP-binding protein
MLEIENLSVAYGPFKALHNVSFRCAGAGRLHGVIGPNGAGKTTLMDALSGRNLPTSGRVIFCGSDITRRSVGWRRLNGLARSFQKTSIFPRLTVREQLELVAAKVVDDDIGEVVKALGLEALMDERAESIAYGDQRRVDIALALVGRPQMILLDEPAAGLSAQETTALFEHLRHLVERRGVAAMLVEHDVEAVFGFCDLITVLDLGKHLLTGPPAEVRRDERIIKAYLGSAA